MTVQNTRQTKLFGPLTQHAAVTALVVAAFLLPHTVAAANVVWDGKAGVLYTNDMNWVGNAAPRNNDYQDVAIFREIAPDDPPANRTPTLSGNRSVTGVRFEDSVGWSILGSGTFTMKTFRSTGVGTNTIAPQMKNVNSATWFVGEGNTVIFEGGLYVDHTSTTITLDGGGFLQVNAAIAGWSSGRRFRVLDGVLRVTASVPMNTHGAVIIGANTGRLQLKTTVVAAKNLIGDDKRIRDGVGLGLTVTDIGGGYVEVSVAPRPTLITLR